MDEKFATGAPTADDTTLLHYAECMAMVTFHVDVTPGSDAPNSLVTTSIDSAGALTMTPDSSDQVGDHIVSITLLYSSGDIAKEVIVFTISVI